MPDLYALADGLTDFADQAVILPVYGLAFVALLAMGWWRAAAAWFVVVAAVLSLVLVGKVAAFDCAGEALLRLGLHSPSGHTAAASVVYGGLFALLRRGGQRQAVALLSGLGVAVLIGITRIVLGAHSLIEVVVGGVIGMAGAWTLVRLAGPRPMVLPYLRRAALAIIVVAIVVHGVRLPAEARITNAAHMIWPFSLCRAS